jgi:hypothetical protein
MRHSGDTELGNSTAAKTTFFARAGVGRIVEVRVGLLAGPADFERLTNEASAAVRAVGSGAVICADLRGAAPMTREVAGLWSTGMRRANRDIARSALLLDSSNTLFNLQIERVVRCAGNERRRLFVDEHELRRWLDDCLTNHEREALRTLFSSVPHKPSAGGLRPFSPS